MYELVEEASQVLREPPPVFDFDNPPEDPKEIASKMAAVNHNNLALENLMLKTSSRLLSFIMAKRKNLFFFSNLIS